MPYYPGTGATGEVVQVYISPAQGEPMRPVHRIRAIDSQGLEGDRYALGSGTFSKDEPQIPRHVTLIASEAIAAANEAAEVPFLPEETRRNIVTKGIDLNRLIDTPFLVGDVWMRGVELCGPCGRSSKLLKNAGIIKPDFEEVFDGQGGLRAKIISSGTVAIGNLVVPRFTLPT